MSVPVSYSAANAKCVADVDSGLENSLKQEEQYYLQQEEEKQTQRELQMELYYQKQLQLQQEQKEEADIYIREQQKIIMERKLLLKMSKPNYAASPNQPQGTKLYRNVNNNSNAMDVESQDQNGIKSAEMNSVGAAANVVFNQNDDNMGTDDWLRMYNEGRYGLPGAAGLDKLSNKNNSNMSRLEKTMQDIEEKLYAMTTEQLYSKLKEYYVLEHKYHTVLFLPKESKREVTAGGRDGSAYVLRCLKMWYELPSDVLFAAMSLVDRFLDSMTVKPKHMACLSVASFYLAIKQLNLGPIPAEDLVAISQCGCTAGDLERMARVIANKLGVQMGVEPCTSVSFIRIYYALFYNMANEIGGEFFKFFQKFIKLGELENRLEILLCDVSTTITPPTTLALVLISLHLDFHIKESYTRGTPELKIVFDFIVFLQKYLSIPDRVFNCGFSTVSGILSHYNGQNKTPYKQRLVWKLSSRTMRVLRPINRFSSDLATIEEGISNAMDDDDGCRSRTESISSEEEEDWPTSPIIPIFEQC